MKRAKWSAPPGLGPGAGILARLVRARAIRRGTGLSLTTNGYSGVTPATV